jgi:hypothetical protein
MVRTMQYYRPTETKNREKNMKTVTIRITKAKSGLVVGSVHKVRIDGGAYRFQNGPLNMWILFDEAEEIG